MQFVYEGTDREGNEITRDVEAADRFAVYEHARNEGHRVRTVRKMGGWTNAIFSSRTVERINTIISRVSADTLSIYTRNLSSMLTAGLPLSRALSVLERQNTNPKLLQITRALHAEVSRGTPFFEALASHPRVFSPLYVSMVHAGEESGALADTLRVLATQLARSAALTKRVRSAMIYPAIVLIVMVIITVLMMIYVMPTLTATFKGLGADLPTTTRILIGTSEFLSTNALFALGGMAVALFGVGALVRTRPGTFAWHYALLRIPVIGSIAKEINAARTTRTLASLMSSGVDIIEAITITKDVVQNVHYRAVLGAAAVTVEKGAPLSETLITHDHLYPPLVGEMTLVGEETGNVSGMLENVAEFYENEVEMKTKDLSTIVEPLLMVVIGGVVGFFALAMIAPIYSISDSIG